MGEAENPKLDLQASQGAIEHNAGTVQQQFGDNIDVRGGDYVQGDKNVYMGEVAYQVSGPSPFLGLQAFGYDERNRFAGHTHEIDTAVKLLTEPGEQRVLLFITGVSGSGKSSFAQAGLLPALEQHNADLKLTTARAVLRPSKKPLAALAQALQALGLPADDTFAAARPFMVGVPSSAPDQNTVGLLIIDQFEELFTQSDADQRDALFAILAALPPFARLRMHIVCTFRSDYLPELFKRESLYEVAKQGIDLRAMSQDELKDAIQQPLHALYPDKRFEPSLLDRLAADAAGDPAYLPLLQVTLDWLWRKGSLTPIHYTSLTGGFRDHADAVLGFMDHAGVRRQPRSAAEQQMILDMLCNLVNVSLDDDPQHDARRQRTLHELTEGDATRERLIRELSGADARLLSMGQEAASDSGGAPVETVDIIHESLITHWDKLTQAVAGRREELQQRHKFEVALNDWLEQRKTHPRTSDRYLLEGVGLAEAEALAQRNDVALRGADARELLSRSSARRLWQTLRVVAALSVLLVAAIIAAILALAAQRAADTNAAEAQQASTRAVQQQTMAQAASTRAVEQQVTAEAASIVAVAERDHAQQQAQIAKSQALAALALANQDRALDLSLLLAGASYQVTKTFEARSSLLSVLQHSPRLLQFQRSHMSALSSVAFSPDGRTLASAGLDTTILLWDVSDPRAPKPLGAPLIGHTDNVWSVVFSPDGKTLASESGDGTILLWDVSDPRAPKPLATLTVRVAGGVSVAFSPDGQTLASGNGDGTIRLWDVSERTAPKPLGAPLIGHTDNVWSVVFSPDGKTLASGSDDGTIRLWDVSERTASKPLSSPLTGNTDNITDSVNSVAFSPDGRTLASAGSDTTIRLWDVSERTAPKPLGAPLTGHTGTVLSVVFSPDGQTLASAGSDTTIRLWDVSERTAPKPLGAPLIGHADAVRSVAFSPDGQTLASASTDKTIIVWDMSERMTPQPLGSFPPAAPGYSGAVNSVAFSPDGKTLASASEDKSVILWDVSERTVSQPLGAPLTGHTDAVNSVAFSPDGKTLASASADKTIRLWDVSDPRASKPLGAPLTGHTSTVRSVAFRADGRMLASASADQTIRLWDVSDPRTPQSLGSPLTGHTAAVNSVAFSPDGKTLASASADQTIRLWDVSDPRTPQSLGSPLTGHTAAVNSVAFSPDGKTLASASDDQSIRLWDASDPRAPKLLGSPLTGSLTGHMSTVRSVAFSLDGKMLASGNEDQTIRLWDVSDPWAPKLLGSPLTSHTNWVFNVAFSPDDQTLASGNDGIVILWDIDIASWITRACHIANRNLTQAEWRQYMGAVPYQKTCPDLPPGE